MKRKVLGLNSARLYGMTPDVAQYPMVPDDYHRRIRSDVELMRTMEYDDRLPNELPAKDSPEIPSSLQSAPYGVAAANRGDRLEKLRAEHRHEAETRFGVPRSNRRDGWIRVK